MGFLWGLLAILMAGCWVNKASIDPFAYAPESPCWYWIPDEKASALASEKTDDSVDIPDEKCILSLSEVLDIALINNTQTQITWAQARRAAAEYGLSQSTAFPNISAEFFHTKSRTAYLASQVEQPQNVMGETLIINNQMLWGPKAHLTWTLLDFGQRRYTSEAARYMLYFADYTHNQAVQTVLETITLDYYNYLYQKKLLEANEADLANAEETLAAAEQALRKGVKNISDVLQARKPDLFA
ncbi:MAG: hypothetical protein K1000chlam2_01298 [Chlamydiae bacterium]|nr:hypothetical protein [Chlamydiota bacterium]